MAVIEFENVSKAYRLGVHRTSLREAISQLSHELFHRKDIQVDNSLFWALDDVSFQVEEGEVLGIIGNNGAGKSTTLKLLSKVTAPTSGHIYTRGRMAALIELGAGFHPDLTGRENVYLNGSILGLKQKEISDSMPDIVEFAGLENFIDTPVKRYSSGMYVRLAFSIAAHVKAELLLIDEVLSVGDISFQVKSMAKMNELRDSGATIVYISHNLPNVTSFCKRVLLLEKGKIIEEGDPEVVVKKYRELERKGALKDATREKDMGGQSAAENSAAITNFELLNTRGAPTSEFEVDEPLLIRCQYHAANLIEDPGYAVRIWRADGLLCANIISPREYSRAAHKNGCFEVEVGPLFLQPDYYSLNIFIYDRKNDLLHASRSNVTFQIKGFFKDGLAGVMDPKAEWREITATL